MIGGTADAVIDARLAVRVSDRTVRVACALVLALAGIELMLSAAGYHLMLAS